MRTKGLLVCAMLSVLTGLSFGAETVHLTLNGQSQGLIQGDSVQTSLGRANTIACAAYSHMVMTEPDPRSGITGEVRDHFPLTILKQLDRATPKLFKAWQIRERLQAEFRFYRPNPNGDGTTQQFYTVILHNAYIAGIRREVPNTMDAQTSTLPPVERISFTYEWIEEIWVPTGVTAGDDWHANTTKIPLSDVNFDGIVNMNDFAILADDWMTQY